MGRRLLLFVVVAAGIAGFASQRALATAPIPPACSPDTAQLAVVSTATPPILREVSTAHFDVWFTPDPTASNYATDTQALAVAAVSEQAYAAYAALGFPAPLVDSNTGKVEIYIVDLAQYGLSSEVCFGSFYFDSGTMGQADESVSAGWDVFYSIELTQNLPTSGNAWLLAGAAEWAAAKAFGYPSEMTTDLGPPEMSLDCWDDVQGSSACSKLPLEELGESRWPFYEYLAERFGNTFIDEVLSDSQSAGSSLVGLENALVAHGTTLGAAYGDYSTRVISGGWTASGLDVVAPSITGSPILTGAATGAIQGQTVTVNHLATRYLEIDRGDGSGSHPCYSATLALTVQIPTGVTSQPVFYWNGSGSAAMPLTVSGSTATATVPWDTCVWANKGYLSLPNASTNVDGANFVVSGTLTVDTTAPANSSPPPAPASTYGTVIVVGTSDVVPAISIFGPQLMTLSSVDTQVRLIVESTDEGSLKATLGSLNLGSVALRPGENDLRYTVPKDALAALRRSASSSSLLTLTPISPDGLAAGPVVTRTVSITPATSAQKAAATAKAKAAAKAKAKAKAKAAAKAKSKAKSKPHK